MNQIKELATGQIIASGGYSDIVELLRSVDDTTSTHSSSNRSSRKYVVKRLRNDLSSSAQISGAHALAFEAQLLQKLNHPNIIPIYSSGNRMGEHNFYIVIERLDVDLRQQIRLWKGEEAKLMLSKSKSKTTKQEILEEKMYDRLDIAHQVASALYYLHEHKIIYRDMKPQNLGLDKFDHVRIYDFGLSKELSDDMKVEKDHRSGMYGNYERYLATNCVGTPRYMAPEVYSGNQYGLPVDIYSYSLVLWELVTLEVSFDEEVTCSSDLISKIYEKKLRPSLRREWPKEVKRLLQKGWQHDAWKRPEALEFCDELQICMRQKILKRREI